MKRTSTGDEYYTPRYGVLPLVPYIPKDKIVWCPFDTPRSEFVRVLQERGIQCVYSHICYGQDFFEYEPPQWDILLSNPPFSMRTAILQRCIDLGKPFALLLPNIGLNNGPILRLMKSCDIRLLLFDKRIEFLKSGRVPLSTAYFCRDLLPEKLIVETLKQVPRQISAMYDDPDIRRYAGSGSE